MNMKGKTKICKVAKRLSELLISGTIIVSLLISNVSAITTSYYSKTAYHPWYGVYVHNFNGYGGNAIANSGSLVWGYPSKTSLISNGEKSHFCQLNGSISSKKVNGQTVYNAAVDFTASKGTLKSTDYSTFLVNIFKKDGNSTTKIASRDTKFYGSYAYSVSGSDTTASIKSSVKPYYAQAGAVFSSDYLGTWYGGVYCAY